MASGLSIVRLRALIGLSKRPSAFRLLVILYALLNLKNLPLAWHVRVFWGFLSQIYRTRGPLPPTVVPAVLFQPMITRARNSWHDCDWNIHKSNSTYFTDFDVARCHLVTWICRRGLARLRKEYGTGVAVALGGAHCTFRREIKPYQQFEIWTRILAWDRKWLYIISHFVKKGEVKPRGWTLQPWRSSKASQPQKEGANGHANGSAEKAAAQPHPAIYASAIAKYVFKKGRLTVAPSLVLEASGLLPPKPVEQLAPDSDSSLAPNGGASTAEGISAEPVATPLVEAALADDVLEASLTAQGEGEKEWNWQRIEEERLRGMRIAELFNGLDGLNAEFRGGDDHALGIFRDPF